MKNIFQFELKQLFRDKTIFFIFILPMLLMPVLSGGLTFFTKSRLKSISEEKVTVLMQNDSFIKKLEGAFTIRQITPVYADSIPVNADSLKKQLSTHVAVIRVGISRFTDHSFAYGSIYYSKRQTEYPCRPGDGPAKTFKEKR